MDQLWELGIIGPWYLTHNQLDAYQLLKDKRTPFIEAGRRFGKTTTTLVHYIEEERKKEGSIWRWCEPWKNQAREIVIPEMENITRSAPKRFKFRYYKTDSVFEGPTGGLLYLRGVNEDKGESARGSKADGIIADEIGSWNDPDYIRNEVLRPQLLTTGGQFIEIGTPPEDLGHSFYTYKDKAIKENRFIQKTIFDNDLISKERIQEICEECGGPTSPAWLREYLCKPVSTPEKLVIPEYDEEKHDIDDSYPKPDHFDAYVGADLGFHDNSAFLFGYYDFLKNELVIQHEYVVAGKNSKELVESVKAIEGILWKKPPYLRVSDNEVQQLYDMNTVHGYSMIPTRKDDKIAAINELRVRFGHCKIKIHKRCQSLRYQLKVGLWNDKRTNFLRSDKTGHLDAVDALIYLNRNIRKGHNPYPDQSYAHDKYFVPINKPGVSGDMGTLKEVLTSPFMRKALK